MRLNNLSRLTALLLALTILASSVVWAEPVAEGDWDSTSYQSMLAAQTTDCLCVTYYATYMSGLPLALMNGYTCVYEHLKSLGSSMAQYQFLMDLYAGDYFSTYGPYIQAYYAHIDGTDGSTEEPLLCICDDNLYPVTEENKPGNGKHSADCPWNVAVIIPNIPQPDPIDPSKFEQYTSNEEYDLPMPGDRAIILPEGGRAVIHSGMADGYQWQVYDGAQWVAISGENSGDLVVTTAKLATIFELTSIAELRYFDTANDIVLASVSVTSQEIAGGEYVEPVEEVQTLSLIERADGDKHTVTIRYVDDDGAEIADPFMVEWAEGEDDLSQFVTHPTVMGYEPSQGTPWPEGNLLVYSNTGVQMNISGLTADVTVSIVYKPTLVNYTVIHYAQNVNDDHYTEVARETLQGYTKDTVPEVAAGAAGTVSTQTQFNPAGFYALVYEKPAIAADGSTIVEVYYDRNYYLINFDLAGGYGLEPIYARFGTELGATPAPQRMGYMFAGWEVRQADGKYIDLTEEMPMAMPAENITYRAKWSGDYVGYTIVYWRENADDTNYSYWAHAYGDAIAGEHVSGADTIGQVEGVADEQYFTYNDALTDKNVEVKGDGSTVVNVYYTRNYYTIYFTGYGTCALHEHSEACGEGVLECEQTEHREHDEACLDCEYESHVHSAICYISYDRWAGNQRCWWGADQHSAEPKEGDTWTHQTNYGNLTCVYYDSGWYDYVADGDLNPNTCATGGHEHDAACYTDSLHTHTEACYGYPNCDPSTHTHEHTTNNPNCYDDDEDNIIYVITAKYEQNIADIWPTYDVLKAGGHAYVDGNGNVENDGNQRFRGWSIPGADGTVVSKRATMTADLCDTSSARAKTGTAVYGGAYTVHVYYLFESFDQDSDPAPYDRMELNGIKFDSEKSLHQTLRTSDDEFGQKPVTGMVDYSAESNWTSDNEYYRFLFYRRLRYTLSFNDGTKPMEDLTVEDVMYDQPIKDVITIGDDGNPTGDYWLDENDCPFEDGKIYQFLGWYTTPECFDGTEYDFTTGTMPNSNLMLYAKWEPISVTVEFYLTAQALATDAAALGTQTIRQGDLLEAVEVPTNGSYTFVGWFYTEVVDNVAVEKAIDIANTPITKDLKVYAKWTSNTLVPYEVKYVLQSDHDVEIADPTTGSALAGMSRTFNAKGDTDLYEDYQKGYFPVVKSHSLLMHMEYVDENGDPIEGEDGYPLNTYYFEYVQREAVPYIIRYVEAATDEELSEQVLVADNRKAVVTETFKVISGYMPDAYQKRLIVNGATGDDVEWIEVEVDGKTIQVHPDNVITFYYTADTTHAYYKVTHYTQNLDGSYSEYTSNQYIGVIGQTGYEDTPLTISGFEYVRIEYVVGNAEATTEEPVLTAAGLEINLYYERLLYPYKIRHLEYGTNAVLVPTEPGTAKYGATITGAQANILGYELKEVTPASASITIRVEEGTEAKLNIITFYYKETEATINYVVVGPTGCGTVDLNDADTATEPGTTVSENVKILTGTAVGATAAVAADSNLYRFVGWYDNEACTGTPISTEESYVPKQPESDTWPEKSTYYAKFEYNLTSLTIKKAAAEGTTIGTDETFIFTVTGAGLDDGMKVVIQGTGEVTINGLTVGETYTVVEDTNWAWRYESSSNPSNGQVELKPEAAENVITFTNTKNNDKWLSDESAVENKFNQTSTTTEEGGDS